MTDAIRDAVLQRIREISAPGRRIVAAIDGRCASGKTTLALGLQRLTGCAVFHMDDFFLRPEQRTAERLASPGENVDHERFLAEVLLPLKSGAKTIEYRPFDCRTTSLLPPVRRPASDLVIVEGSYSCHDELFPLYDLTVFLTVPNDEQLRRIIKREGAAGASVFTSRWIPLEEAYFEASGIEGRADMRFDASIQI